MDSDNDKLDQKDINYNDSITKSDFNLLIEHGFTFLEEYYQKQMITISDCLVLSLDFPSEFRCIDKLSIIAVTYTMINKFKGGLDDIDPKIRTTIQDKLIDNFKLLLESD